LTKLNFDLVELSDIGMCKYYLWKNNAMNFALTNDRGYYECEIIPLTKPINCLAITRLLRFLKNDVTYYMDELVKANLYYTLTTDEYVNLFNKNYDLIGKFLSNYNEEKYEDYNKFEFRFEGIAL
jgi:hypothetical protein